MQAGKILSWETKEGPAITAHGYTVTPVAQALHLHTRFGGLVWNRPVAVLIDEGGSVTRLPIVDVTRVALWAMAGGAGLTLMITRLLSLSRSTTEE